jgi:hypothetical protein
MSVRSTLLGLLVSVPCTLLGLIVFDAENTSDPGTGAPWSHTAQQQRLVSGLPIIDSSAVYIGNGYILTANHTYGPSAVILDGVAYLVDSSFPAISLTPIDLRLYKILNPPPLAMLPLPDAADSDTAQASTLIGWGKGKGDLIARHGWTWGGTLSDDVTKAKRWGTNTTTDSAVIKTYTPYSYNALQMDFNSTPSTEATAAMSDSGGGVFQQFETTWKLAGIITLAPFDSVTYPNGNSFYNPAYQTFAVRLKDIASQFRYLQWMQEKGIAEATASEDDADGDGLGLLEEYAFGMDPAVPSTEGEPTVAVEGSDLALTYRLERTRTDLSIAIEESTDLVSWSPASVSSITTVTEVGSLCTYKAKVPVAEAEKKFLRLKITNLAT